MFRILRAPLFAIPAILFGVAAGAGHAAPPTVDEFLAFSGVDDVAVSPDGKHLAAVQDTDNRDIRALVVYRIEGGSLIRYKELKFRNKLASALTWANDDRLLVTLHEYDPETGSTMRMEKSGRRTPMPPQILALDASLQNRVVLLKEEYKFRRTSNKAQILHPLPGDPEHILMAIYTTDRDPSFDIYKVSVYDGSAELFQRGNIYTTRWMVDQAGNVRLRVDARNFWTNISARASAGGGWFEIGRYRRREIPDLNPIAFSEKDPDILYVAAPYDDDRLAIFEYKIRERRLGRMLFSHPGVDFSGGIFTLSDSRIVGFRYVVHKPHGKYLDRRYQAIAARLEKMFGAKNFARPISATSDEKLMVIEVTGPRNPGTFYLFDVENNKARPIGVTSESLNPDQMGIMKPVVYRARDGVEINAYLTVPPGNPPHPPLVVMPHGGPEARDFLTWDRLAQFIATRGYAVLQPNFRGSHGFGKKFAESGYKQWGLKMQDDITDGVRYVVEQGWVDPGRICIFGWSYGGYAALAGAAFTPELYKCAVSVNGIGDLYAQILWERGRKEYHYWKKSIGDPGNPEDRQRMKDRSPVTAVEHIKVPVLIVAGDDDDIVPVAQSREMAKALKEAGKPYKYIEFEGEGHSFSAYKHNKRLYEELEAFLARYLGKPSQNTAVAR